MKLNISKEELTNLVDFLNESEEHLNGIEERILKLEASKELELVNSIFRPIHTIKGTSSFFGLKDITAFSHEVETLLDDIRKGRISDISGAIIDVLLESVDVISRMLKRTMQAVGGINARDLKDELQIDLAEIEYLDLLKRVQAERGAGPETERKESGESVPDSGIALIDYALIKYPAELKDDFEIESEEHLQRMEEILLSLEENPRQFAIYNDLFRSLHSLKGNAGLIISMVEDEFIRQSHFLNRFRDLAHGAESLVQQKRDNHVSLSGNEIEMLLLACDLMKKMLKDFQANRNSEVDVNALIMELNQEVKGVVLAGQTGLKEIGGDSLGLAVSASIQQSLEALEAGISELADDQKRAKALNKMKRALGNLAKVGRKIRHPWMLEKAEEGEKLLQFMAQGRDENEEAFIAELQETVNLIKEKGDRRKAPEIDRRKSTMPPSPTDKALEAKIGDKVIRVAQEKIDIFMNLIGELLVSKNNLNALAREIAMKYDIPEIANRVKEVSDTIGRISDELHVNIMDIRMLPLANAFSRFPRMIRDLSNKLQKQMKLEISGEETEIDKTIIEALGDPLVHLIRNSADHGIENPEDRRRQGKPDSGTIQLRAFNQGQHVVIQISDDGRGIDAHQVKIRALERGIMSETELQEMDDKRALGLIFMPGFSLAKEVTDVSGRGVGMDVVKTNIEKIGGTVDIDSVVNQGTTITLKLPLTMAIGRGLEIAVSSNRYYMPLEYIVETIKTSPEKIFHYKGGEMTVIRNELIPVFRLRDQLGVNGANGDRQTSLALLIMLVKNRKIGVIVDEVFNEDEYVIKALTGSLSGVEGISGAMITGSGSVNLILDPMKLF